MCTEAPEICDPDICKNYIPYPNEFDYMYCVEGLSDPDEEQDGWENPPYRVDKPGDDCPLWETCWDDNCRNNPKYK